MLFPMQRKSSSQTFILILKTIRTYANESKKELKHKFLPVNMSEPVIIIEPRKNWTYAEKGRRPQHKNKEEGGKEGGEEGGREGEGEGAGRAEIAEIAEITVAEGHGRSGEGSKRRRGV
ncbi:hypothetical protein Glove_9g313 [Diversispora epigaea]|uniref:Uncharacterized protein n=1 Tax=Diversispora epigaea TaxID=1348612 RepID=A0A397JYA6_9GLOM|nr:hypothetical protein Glove_9g313 [Diversispora epigaea]